MKKNNKKHMLEYQDAFLYQRITSVITNSDFDVSIESPFKYKNGDILGVYIDDDVVSGIGQRNFQRQRLEDNRGKLLIFYNATSNRSIIVGRWSKVKSTFTLYTTERIAPDEIKILNLVYKHLTENNITTIICLDEKERYRIAERKRRGDFIQCHNREH